MSPPATLRESRVMRKTSRSAEPKKRKANRTPPATNTAWAAALASSSPATFKNIGMLAKGFMITKREAKALATSYASINRASSASSP